VIPGQFRQARWKLAALGSVAAAAVLVLVFLPGRRDHVPGPVGIEPLPVHIPRGADAADSFEVRRVQGLGLYAARQYEAAIAELRQAHRLRPDDAEVLLYGGSALLLLGRVEEGLTLLHQAAGLQAAPSVREEVFWHTANAALALGDADQARAALQEVVSMDRRHRDEAEALLSRLD
jgi:tetratricopeptide (TPR) repeat protein